MSLCMLLLAASILFYRVDSGIIIPLIYRKICSISLIFLTCFISILATVEFNTTITEVIDNYKNITHLYSYSMVILAKNCYIFVAVIYILTCVFIAYLMITYGKLNTISKNLR